MSGKEHNPMKTKIKAVLFALFTAVMIAVPSGIAVAADTERQYTVLGAGNDSCAKFLKEHEEEGLFALVYISWITGFVSATGAWDKAYNDKQKSLDDNPLYDMEGLIRLIRAYCINKPLDSLANATRTSVALLRHLERQ